MRKSRGQALIEFIIILPVLALIIASMVDVFNIMKTNYDLESNLTTIVSLYSKNDEEAIEQLKNEYKLDIDYENLNSSTTKIIVNKRIRIGTPVLKNILGNPYTVTVSRVVYNEEEE